MPGWLTHRSLQGPVLFILDAMSVYLAMGITHQVRLNRWVPVDAALLLVALIVLVALYLTDVYHFSRQAPPLRHALRAFAAVAVSGVAFAAFLDVAATRTTSTVLERGNLLLGLALVAYWAGLIRYVGSIVYARFGRRPRWLVVGSEACAAVLKQNYHSSRLEGRFDAISGEPGVLNKFSVHGDGSLVVSDPDDRDCYRGRVSGIVLEESGEISQQFANQLMHARLAGVPVLNLSDFYEEHLLRVPVMELRDRWFALSRGFRLVHRDVELKMKRVLDVLIASLGLVLLSPLLLLVGLLVRGTSRGPALYSQTRCGVNGREFSLHKFRTMRVDAEQDGPQWSPPGDDRITRIGRFLRKTRIDELPQLWNVLIGEMSFSGPRPERPSFVAELKQDIPYYDMRHLVKPGITGWAQVMYPYGSSKEDAKNKLEFDLYYIKNYSLALDLYILLRTAREVFWRNGR